MVQFKDLIRQCVTLTTNDCVSDSEKVRKLSAPYHPRELICLKETIYIKFNSDTSATEFIKKLKP